MSNFTDPIKAAFGVYLGRFHAGLIPDTPAVAEFASRPLAKAAVWAPGRMIDQVEDMLAAYRKNDNSQAVQPKTPLPILIAAMAKDFVGAPAEFGRNLSDAIDVQLPQDPKQRVFRMRAVAADIRTQVAVIAADDASARSIAMQLHAFTSAISNRHFSATFRLAGLDDQWPVMLEIPDLIAMSSPTEVKNLTMLVLDVTLRATVPLLTAPKAAEPNDGAGSGNTDHPNLANYDPNGYLVVTEAHGQIHPDGLNRPAMNAWAVQVDP